MTLRGQRGPDGYVLDFGEVKTHVVALCKKWNERFICPMKSDVLTIDMASNDANVTLSCEDGSLFSFPKADCLFLPIYHSSAEELAEHFCTLLVEAVGVDRLRERGIFEIQLSIAEAAHQEAIYTLSLAPTAPSLPALAPTSASTSGTAPALAPAPAPPTPKPCLAAHDHEAS